jgi:putative ABC transport system permease protein
MLEHVRHALRSLLHDWRMTALAAGLVAITIGTLMAVFALFDAVVLRPFPFVDQARVAVIWPRDDRRAMPVMEVTYANVADWAARTRTFEALSVVGSVNWNLSLVQPSGQVPVEIAAVSSAFFRVVGTSPAIGRGLAPDDDAGTPPRAMVISHGLWTRQFGGDRGVIGRVVSIALDADTPPVPITIAGVMPAGFDYPRGAEAWVPAAPLVRRYGAGYHLGPEQSLTGLGVFYAIGRLKHGVSMDGATAEITRVMRTAATHGGPEPPERLVVTPISEHLLGPAGPVQVSRAARRERGLAIRAALGASSHGLTFGVIVESALLTLAALAGGIVVAWLSLRGLLWLAPAGVPRIADVALLDGRVLTAGGVATFVTIALCALWPVRVARRIDAAAVLAQSSPRTADPRGRRLQRAIVVGQVAVSLTLLVGTALFLRTVRGLDRTVLGFDPAHLLAFAVAPPTGDRGRWNRAYDATLRRLAGSPGVQAAGAVLVRPLSGPVGFDAQLRYPDQAETDVRAWGLNPHVNLEAVTPGYFRAMGIHLQRGRLFDDRDVETAPGTVLVSEGAARRLWPGKDPIGQRLTEPTYRGAARGAPLRWQTVIGVVDDVRYRGLNDPRLDVYVPAAQSDNRVQHLMVRTSGDVATAVAAVRAAVREADPTAFVSEATVMSDVVAAESAPWRFLTQVFLAFASLAALLATVGLGAIVALEVTARRRELAIRAALGADGRRLRRLVIGDALRLVGLGLAGGLAATLAFGRVLDHVLIGIGAHDAIALASAAGAAGAVTLIGAWIPARRASKADPIWALRSE